MFDKNRHSIYKALLRNLFDFVAPPHCLVCNSLFKVSNSISSFICNKCYDNIPFADEKEIILNRFHRNFENEVCYVSEATALMNIEKNEGYIEIIHAIKYNKFKSLGLELGEMLANRLIYDKMIYYDYIVPIPIHFAKKRERGFNQSDLIAKGLCRKSGLIFSDDILIRKKYTVTQTKLNKSDRKKNMTDVFEVKKNQNITNKSILLIDDVLTTGSTLNSAAAKLIESGAKKVGIATLALAH